jgi:hypothetical protein
VFDPAVLGTLLIGLNAERAEAHGTRRHRAVSAAGGARFRIRATVARGLRRVAALLDQPRVGEVVSPR